MQSNKSNDQLIDHIVSKLLSPFKNYQKIIIALICIVWVQTSIFTWVGGFAFQNPIFICNSNQTSEQQACQHLEQCYIQNDFSVTYHNHLYCDRKADRQFIQSSRYFGSLIGGFFIPILTDYKGRRFGLLFCELISILGILIIILGINIDEKFTITIGHIITGISVAGIISTTYIITLQLCSTRLRKWAIIFYNAMWGFGEASFILIYYLLPQWYNFLILILLIPFLGLLIVSYVFIIETPSYTLLNMKNMTQFQKSIKQIAIINNAPQNSIQESIKIASIIQQQNNTEVNNQKKSLKQILTELLIIKKNRKVLISVSLVYSGYFFSYVGAQLSTQRTGYNFGITMLFIGVTDFICNCISSYIIKKVPRKKGVLAIVIFITVLGLLFIFPQIHQNPTIQTVITPFFRFSLILFYAFIIMLQTESFPSTIRSTALGLINIIAKLCSMTVPYVVTWMNDLQIHPLVATTIIGFLLSFLPTFWIEQTFVGKIDKSKQEDMQQSLISKKSSDDQQVQK